MLQEVILFQLAMTDEGTAAAAAGSNQRMDRDTFSAFYSRHARALHAYLRRSCGQPSLAEDLLQESFCRLLRVPTDHMGEREKRAFLFKIASNLAADQWRRQQRRTRLLERFRSSREDEKQAPVSETSSQLDRLLAPLSPRDRSLLWLAYVEGYTHEEIARMLGLKPRSIRVMLYRARRRTAHLLTQHDPSLRPPAAKEPQS